MNTPVFNFIVGIGRSGTTLLMSMLNSHPELQATPEVNFFVFFYGSWKHKTDFTEADFVKVEFYMSKYDDRKQVSGFEWKTELFRENIRNSPEINFEIIYKCFYESFVYAGAPKAISHNFDKNPINTLFLQDIIDILPNSKFIFLVRDPRANFLSRKEKLKKRKADIYLDTKRWTHYNAAALTVIEKNRDKFYILKYEDLVTDPKAELQKLATFFNFPYDESMLNFHTKVKENSLKKVYEKSVRDYPQAKDKFEKLSRPVNTDRLDIWKSKLNKQEIGIVSDICRIAEKFGYDMSADKPKLSTIQFCKGTLLARLDIIKSKLTCMLPVNVKLTIMKSLAR
ncbi:MAG: sulfotransferase [Bacteroidota bacterium]